MIYGSALCFGLCIRPPDHVFAQCGPDHVFAQCELYTVLFTTNYRVRHHQIHELRMVFLMIPMESKQCMFGPNHIFVV